MALARFGRATGTAAAVLTAALLVVAAGTLAGVLGLAVSSAYDYHLQRPHGGHERDARRSAMRPVRPRTTDLALQVRAVRRGGGLMLVTNLVLVAWALALRGGRMSLGTRLDGRSASSGRIHDLRLLLVAGLVGSAAIHAAVIPEHLQEWAAAGSFFVVLAIAELAVAGLLLLMRPGVLVAAAVVSARPSCSGSSRSVGLPFGPRRGYPRQWDWPTSRAACSSW